MQICIAILLVTIQRQICILCVELKEATRVQEERAERLEALAVDHCKDLQQLEWVCVLRGFEFAGLVG
jgi:hypothetical protein